MTLLHLLHELAPKHGWKLTVAHFNHQLRGRRSDADERLVRATAKRLRLPFVAGRARVKRPAKQHGLSVEMAARQLRHAFLAGCARRRRCPTIALAHHADDQVELFFLRVLRGAGGEGLAGMKWRSPSPAEVRSPAFRRSDSSVKSGRPKAGLQTQLVRPLLDVSRAELEAFARERKIRFREDATNAASEIPRNRIRHELLPLLRDRFQPALNRSLLRVMEIVGAESKLAESLARAWLAGKQRAFARLAVAVQRRVLQLQLRSLQLAEDFELIESLRLSPGRPVTIRPNVAVERDATGRVRVRTAKREVFRRNRLTLELWGHAGAATLDGLCVRWKGIARVGARLRSERSGEQFDADKVGRRIVLRHWQPGDRFQPIGMNHAVKLQDWFTNQKVPQAVRRRLVVACTASGEVFWIENQRISERFKLSPETKRQLVWTWRRG